MIVLHGEANGGRHGGGGTGAALKHLHGGRVHSSADTEVLGVTGTWLAHLARSIVSGPISKVERDLMEMGIDAHNLWINQFRRTEVNSRKIKYSKL